MEEAGLTATREFTCPACGGRDTRFRQINSGGSGTKCETWGSSNAPEVVLRVQCDTCGETWKRQDG